MFYAQVLGQVVRGARELQGVSLAAMARAMGLSTSGWSRVETGVTTMTVSQLARAARHLKTAPWELVRQADCLVAQLAKGTVVVHDEEVDDECGRAGEAAVLALVSSSLAR